MTKSSVRPQTVQSKEVFIQRRCSIQHVLLIYPSGSIPVTALNIYLRERATRVVRTRVSLSKTKNIA